MTKIKILLSACLIIFISGCTTQEVLKENASIYNKLNEFKNDFAKENLAFEIPYGSKVDTIIVDSVGKHLQINLSKEFAAQPFREDNVNQIYSSVKSYLGISFNDYVIEINCLNFPIKELIPNYYRGDTTEYDYSRLPSAKEKERIPIVQNTSKPYSITKGLEHRNIILWHSHGWYYNIKSERWEWQRPRLFQTVEDLLPMSFTIPYLIPMLENAGANVFTPRERDTQTNEVIVDNDNQTDKNQKNYLEINDGKHGTWKKGLGKGFAVGNPPYGEGVNPFRQGTFRVFISDTNTFAHVEWVPQIPENGYYAVYISYKSSDQNVDDANYTVYHAGGKTDFRVNQKIGGSTWIYLGEFKFFKGMNREIGRVELTGESNEVNKIISADAVRFGGGVGVIERGGSTSGRPKFEEGARYWLQFAGMPDTLIYNLNDNKNDYNDDYQSRAEYGNYLNGAPGGPNKDRENKGLGIPMDLSMAFHTNAGDTKFDTTYGTLSIYSLDDFKTGNLFPDGMSRLANRDLADIIQTQIVNDLRNNFDDIWKRRQLMNGDYSESRRPNVPSVLLELLSHQNFLDMQFALDPRFRFEVSRSIYIGMLKFLSVQDDFKYVVQPLPIDHFSLEFINDNSIKMKWKAKLDPLEKTAVPNGYIVYTRIDNGDFDNGQLVKDTSFVKNDIEPNKIYSFKVTAVNEGGESFPSEILSAGKADNSKNPVLIVNAFDRICGPRSVKTDKFSGFLNNLDAGVPYKYDINFTGAQYDFDPNSPYISNDAPGFGASHSNFETKIVAGNTFDFPFIHGKAIMNSGYSFVSSSDESVWDKNINLSKYKFVDIILGEEKETSWQKPYADSVNGKQFKTFPLRFQNVIRKYTDAGGNLFISGAYVGTDLFSNRDTVDIKFAKDVLKFRLDAGYASVDGEVESKGDSILGKNLKLHFNTELNDSIYAVEAPDAILPVKDSKTILRYSENQFSAGTAFKDKYGVVVLGFPFETILGEKDRDQLMHGILNYLGL